MNKDIYEYYLKLGQEGGGDEYVVNNKTRYAFLLGEDDFALFAELETSAGSFLLIGEDDFYEIAETYEDEDTFDDEDDDDDEEEPITGKEKAIKTIRLLRKSSSDESIANLLKAVNEAGGYDIKLEDLDNG